MVPGEILWEDFGGGFWDVGFEFSSKKSYSWVANAVQREIPRSKFVGWSDLFFPSKRRRRYNGKCCSPPFKFQPRKSELQICWNGNTRPCKSLGCSPRMLVTRTTIRSQVSRIPMNLHLPLLLGEVSHHSCIFWNSIHYPFLQREQIQIRGNQPRIRYHGRTSMTSHPSQTTSFLFSHHFRTSPKIFYNVYIYIYIYLENPGPSSVVFSHFGSHTFSHRLSDLLPKAWNPGILAIREKTTMPSNNPKVQGLSSDGFGKKGSCSKALLDKYMVPSQKIMISNIFKNLGWPQGAVLLYSFLVCSCRKPPPPPQKNNDNTTCLRLHHSRSASWVCRFEEQRMRHGWNIPRFQ